MAENPAVEPEGPESDTMEAMARDRSRRSRRLALFGGVFVVAVGGGLFGLTRYQEAQSTAHIEGAWGAFSRCLVGKPLEAGEHADVRFRALQLTAMTLPEPQRAPANGQSWPGRCGGLGYALSESLKDGGRAVKGEKDLAFWAESLAKQLKEGTSFTADLSENVLHTWEEAEKAKLPATAGPEQAATPTLPQPLSADALAAGTPLTKAPFSLKSLYTDPHPNQKLHLLVDEKSVPGSPFLCTITGQKAQCASLPKAITDSHQGVRLLGTADDEAAPLIFAGKRGNAGVYRADTGEPVDRIFSYGGYAAKDGFSALLGWNEADEELRLIRKPSADGKKDTTTIKPDFRIGNYYYNAQMLWDHVLLRGVNKSDSRRLFALNLTRGDKLGEPVDVGELSEAGLHEYGPDEPPHIAGCRTAEIMAVRVKGYDNEFLSFLVNGHWSTPVLVPATGGTLSCRKADAAITGVYPSSQDSAWKTTVEQRRCTTAGCTDDEIRMEQLLSGQLEFSPKEGRAVAADLDGKMLIVWSAGERGGVRMRLAAVDQIVKAPDILLFDDLIKDGKVQNLSTLFDMRLFSREGYAILVLSTVSGVHAIRIEADGKFAPLMIDWAK
ncbi:MAG: hypothetical protein ABI193_14990 [Minicystis sp.]